MKTLKLMTMLLFALASFQFAQAQSVDDLVKEWERAKTYTKQYLDTMPAAGYSLKPTPEMRSFAEQMLHLTDALYGLTAAATGDQPPSAAGELEKNTTDKSKANITKIVLAGYDFAIGSIKKMTPAKMNEQIKVFGRFDMSRGIAIWKSLEHQTHHRGQTTVYIRLAGAKPPQEMLF